MKGEQILMPMSSSSPISPFHSLLFYSLSIGMPRGCEKISQMLKNIPLSSRLIFNDDENVSLCAEVFNKYLHLSSSHNSSSLVLCLKRYRIISLITHRINESKIALRNEDVAGVNFKFT